MQAAQAGALQFGGRGRRAGRQLFEAELRKRARDIRRQPWPFRRGRGAEQMGRRGELGVAAVKRRIRLVRPVDQKTCGDDQMQRHDRGDDQCRDLSADPFQVQKAGQLHDQLLAAVTASTLAGSTLGVNM